MRELNIDWAALHSAFQMNMPEVRCFLAVEDGRVLKLPPGDPTLAGVRGDPQRYIAIDAIPSRIQYQWLDEFIKSLGDDPVRERMEAAINGKGAFRRFKDILLALPDERRRWFEYRDQRMQMRIVEWVREQGIVALNDAPWAANGQLIDNSSALGVMPNEEAHPSLAAGGISKPAAPALNSQHAVEALRDFLIAWSDQRGQTSMPGPLELEALADQIAKNFRITPVHP